MKIINKEEKETEYNLDSETWRTINPDEIKRIFLAQKDDLQLFYDTIYKIIGSEVEIIVFSDNYFKTKEEKIRLGQGYFKIIKKMQLEKIKDKTKELGNIDIAKKYAELEADFEYIKSLNTDIAEKYEEIIKVFPTSKEMNCLIHLLSFQEAKMYNPYRIKNEEEKKEKTNLNKERLAKLRAFKNMIEHLETQDVYKKPKKYEEMENIK
jgi:hypothetical protein